MGGGWSGRTYLQHHEKGRCAILFVRTLSREQVLATASGLKDSGISYFRSGIWKPRTRPGAFEGVGHTGLPWLQEVQSEFGMKVCVEVAQPRHAEAALEAGIDMLWIGARTTANPFQVQEMADCLRGVDIPVAATNGKDTAHESKQKRPKAKYHTGSFGLPNSSGYNCSAELLYHLAACDIDGAHERRRGPWSDCTTGPRS